MQNSCIITRHIISLQYYLYVQLLDKLFLQIILTNRQQYIRSSILVKVMLRQLQSMSSLEKSSIDVLFIIYLFCKHVYLLSRTVPPPKEHLGSEECVAWTFAVSILSSTLPPKG